MLYLFSSIKKFFFQHLYCRMFAIIIVLYWVCISGEFMQMGSREDPNERFTHYLDKTFKKTASLLAYTCRSVSL